MKAVVVESFGPFESARWTETVDPTPGPGEVVVAVAAAEANYPDILVMQGESEKADENELLGEFILTGLRRAPKGHVEIEVAFEINTDGIASVNAKDLETGESQSIQVTATSGLTQDEVQTMMEDAKDYMVERRTDEAFEAAVEAGDGTLRFERRLHRRVRDRGSSGREGSSPVRQDHRRRGPPEPGRRSPRGPDSPRRPARSSLPRGGRGAASRRDVVLPGRSCRDR